MDQIHELPPAIQDRLPEGPALTDWLLVELDRAHGAADRVHVLGCEATCRGPEVTIAGLKMMRALVLKHRAGPTYVTNVFDPTGPDVPGGWHCRECGLDRDGPTDDWPCEVIVMVATLLWHANRPSLPVAWAWTAPEDQLIWRRGGAGGQTTRIECDAVEPDFTTYDGAAPDYDALRDEHRGGT
jgi:hypothetical protein